MDGDENEDGNPSSDGEINSDSTHNTESYENEHNSNDISHSFPQKNDQELHHIKSPNMAVPVVIQQRYGASA